VHRYLPYTGRYPFRNGTSFCDWRFNITAPVAGEGFTNNVLQPYTYSNISLVGSDGMTCQANQTCSRYYPFWQWYQTNYSFSTFYPTATIIPSPVWNLTEGTFVHKY